MLLGCVSIGPQTVSRDRFDYTAAISDSWKNQMLFNLVKIRYGDAPVFLDVSSVISQYQVAGQVNVGATLNTKPWTTSGILGTTENYVDRPTITYTPILGDKFARSLMAPIPPSAILSLIQTGYPVDVVFRLLVHEINGIRNRFGGEARARSADPEFYSLIEKMRKEKIRTPVIILSAKASIDDRVKGLQTGGDDYLTKPFAFSELLARVQALIRRASGLSEPTRLTVGDLSMNLLTREVTREGKKIELQPIEFSLLEYLLRSAGRVVSKTMIMEHVWDYNFDPQTNVVEARICRLRDKIDRDFDKKLIHTVRGVGYVLKETD